MCKKFFLPFKQAKIRKHGIHLTIVSYGYLIYKTLNAAANIERKHNISIEVIDLVSLKPIDWKTLFFSVKKTNRCLIVHEDNKFMGLGAEIAAEINNNCFVFLDAPIMRHAGLNVHIPYNNILEVNKMYRTIIVLLVTSLVMQLVRSQPARNLQDAQQAPLCTPDFCENPPSYPGGRITELLRDYTPLPGQFDSGPGPRTQG
jgi:pyruvate/2-oxoglutarate/acetoin dehydrogenase E1 component